jgi:hypothetical protein
MFPFFSYHHDPKNTLHCRATTTNDDINTNDVTTPGSIKIKISASLSFHIHTLPIYLFSYHLDPVIPSIKTKGEDHATRKGYKKHQQQHQPKSGGT